MEERSARILLVDDDPSALKALSRILSHYPDQRFATSGEEALRMARERMPDLVMLDAEMPGMTGAEVLDAFQADPALARVPIIFATAHQSPLLEASMLQRGAVDFIAKPAQAPQLTARVRARLRAQRSAVLAGPPAVRAGADAPNASAPRILVVDDDVTAIRALRKTLQGMGDLRFAQTCEDVLPLARRFRPDLIVLDGHLPDGDGLEVCRALKAEPALEHVPVVFLTRYSDPRNERRAFDVGAAEFIAKPYASIVVQARVRNLLDAKRRQDSQRKDVQQRRIVASQLVADIVRETSDAIVSYDGDGRIVLANAAASALFEQDLVGSRVPDVLGYAWPGDAVTAGARLRLQVTRADGRTVPVEAAVSTFGEGAGRLTTVLLHDLSERQRTELETQARVAAEGRNRSKTMMLAAIAHEIGNPLHAILGCAQLMAADGAEPLPAGQARRLALLISSAHHLRAMLHDLSDIAGLEAGRLAVTLQPVTLESAVRGAVAAIAVQSSQAGIAVRCEAIDEALAVQADPERLHQCLINLLSNAVKYNRVGGQVRVSIETAADQVAVAVRDDGIGLSARQLEHLFEPFNRLGRPGPGTGLGLVVTRQLVQAMDGQLRVFSEPGAGSCFTLVLKTISAAGQVAAAAAETHTHPA